MFRTISQALGLRKSSDVHTADAGAKIQAPGAPVGATEQRQSATNDSKRPRPKAESPKRTEHLAFDAAEVPTLLAQVPTIQARMPREHAAALLNWLQGPGGRTGSIFAHELETMHKDMCAAANWERVGWVAVARELRRLLNARKEYGRCAGRRLCVYRIPPASAKASVPPVRLLSAA